MAAVDVVIATRNRRERLLATLDRLAALPEAPRVVVVDNCSDDGSLEAVRSAHAGVRAVGLPANLGAAARNAGVALCPARYVAFCDDDSWWAPGALGRAAAVLDDHPRVGLLAARVLVGPSAWLDPVCQEMAASPLPRRGGPGPAVLGFLACGAVVRRSAFLAVGGFDRRYGIGGEEEILAVDLVTAGWQVCYCPEVVARHVPAGGRDPAARRRREVRNALWTAWLRRRPAGALRRTAGILARPGGRREAFGGLADAASSAGWVLAHRRAVPRRVEAQLRLLPG